MCKAERQHVERVLARSLLPNADRAIEIARDPHFERSDMGLLARRCALGKPARRLRGFRCQRHVCLLVGQQREVTLQAVRQDELWVRGQQRFEMNRSVRTKFQVSLDRAVKRGRGLRRGRRNRQSMDVVVHLVCLGGEC